mmetsp:Transcript_75232/g.244678  ORF Transcript_75232/g.244678 Transcript_75232/m.244678 type:complete len:219 (+) Transcript_75232:2593-3249(+)
MVSEGSKHFASVSCAAASSKRSACSAARPRALASAAAICRLFGAADPCVGATDFDVGKMPERTLDARLARDMCSPQAFSDLPGESSTSSPTCLVHTSPSLQTILPRPSALPVSACPNQSHTRCSALLLSTRCGGAPTGQTELPRMVATCRPPGRHHRPSKAEAGCPCALLSQPSSSALSDFGLLLVAWGAVACASGASLLSGASSEAPASSSSRMKCS